MIHNNRPDSSLTAPWLLWCFVCFAIGLLNIGVSWQNIFVNFRWKKTSLEQCQVSQTSSLNILNGNCIFLLHNNVNIFRLIKLRNHLTHTELENYFSLRFIISFSGGRLSQRLQTRTYSVAVKPRQSYLIKALKAPRVILSVLSNGCVFFFTYGATLREPRECRDFPVTDTDTDTYSFKFLVHNHPENCVHQSLPCICFAQFTC